jgi:CheY-like chemotaxis protein
MTYNNLLLIDDDLDDQDIFNSALARVSTAVKCISMTNAKEALHRLEKNEFVPDAIFLDLNMPIMTGEQFLKEIKEINHLCTIPVIIFSTTSNPSTIETTKRLGASAFITKPNSFEELVRILTPIFTA